MSFDLFWGGAPHIYRVQDAELLDNDESPEPQLDDDEDSEPDYYNPQTGDTSRRIQGAAKETKARRVPGGIAAIAKPIVADYDSDDARIIELKQQGYSDEYVSNKLKAEGRIRYVAKTVGSRWLRLRKVLEDRDDERLDDEMSDWHIGEDEMIATIKDDVDKKFAIQFERLKKKMWKEVSIYLADNMGKKKYSARACEERFEQVKAGEALLPIELDEDQAGRRKMREDRIAKAKADRAAKAQAVKDAEEVKKTKVETRKQGKAEAAEKRRAFLAQKAAEKAERERIKTERGENRLKARDERLVRLALMRLDRDWQLERWRVEKQLLKDWKKKMNGGGRESTGGRQSTGRRKTKDGYDTESEEDDPDDRFESDEEEVYLIDEDGDADDESDQDRRDSFVADLVPIKKTSTRRSNPARSSKKAKGKAKAIDYIEEEEEIAVETPYRVDQAMNKAPVTDESLRNPRSILTMDELSELITQRELERIQSDESQPEVVARLMYADTKLNKAELDDLLRYNSEKVSGKKVDRMLRLQQAEAAKSEKGMQGITSEDIDFMREYGPYKGEWAYLLQEAEDAMICA